MSLFKRKLDITDPETGEVMGEIPFLSQRVRKVNLYGEFIMARQEGFLRLSKEKDLTGSDRRVLDVFFGNLDFENFIQISQQSIADYLEMKKENVSRSTKKLIEKGILIEGTKVGRHNTYRLNPFYGWKGKSDQAFHDLYLQYAKKQQG